MELENLPEDLGPVVAFHGHLCPGVLIGYRASKIALERLRTGRSEDEELVAIVENDSCSVDAVQFMTGATFGKGNFIFRDYGKQVFTFIRRSDGKALRVSLRADGRDLENLTPEEKKVLAEYRSSDKPTEELRQAARELSARALLENSDEKLFDIEWVDVPVPERARIHNSIECESCGEKTMETRIVECKGHNYCIPCSERRAECAGKEPKRCE
jgi:formylmethanofuran dehydrogenase subunit E